MISFGIKDALDVLLVAFFTYQIYKLMKSSGTLPVFSGIVSVVIVWLIVSQVLEMRLMGAILDRFISVGFIVLVVLFQDDIRRFLVTLGSNPGWRFVAKLFSRRTTDTKEQNYIAPVVLACMNMARKKTGALIVIRREMDLSDYAKTGEMFMADINARLIENIFFKNSPLHDGAMIISKQRIKAAGCILPVSHNMDIPKEFGLRHRAALGISQASDAIAVVVSEETGRISAAIKGNFRLRLSAEDLESLLTKEMVIK